MQLDLSSDLIPFGSATVRQYRVGTLTGGDGYGVIHCSQEDLSIRKTHRGPRLKTRTALRARRLFPTRPTRHTRAGASPGQIAPITGGRPAPQLTIGEENRGS